MVRSFGRETARRRGKSPALVRGRRAAARRRRRQLHA